MKMKKLLTALVIAASPLGLQPGRADTPAPFPDFKAKRVKPPAPGSSAPRITVQIDPAEFERARAKAAEPKAAERKDPETKAPNDPPPTTSARYAWFWERISPDLSMASAGRLEPALAALAGAEARVVAPRLQTLQDIARVRGVDILTSTVGTRVSPALVLAVIAVESAGRERAVSTAGAQGLMQLMPDTAARFGVKDSLSPRENISGGVKYLDWLMGEFNSDPLLALAGYNAGEGAVRNHAGVPPYAETRDYVPKVLAAFEVARGLCQTPPLLASDGCVFIAMN
jgi:soluble lytic murein transglycosylase-like protein